MKFEVFLDVTLCPWASCLLHVEGL